MRYTWVWSTPPYRHTCGSELEIHIDKFHIGKENVWLYSGSKGAYEETEKESEEEASNARTICEIFSGRYRGNAQANA